MGLGGGHSGCEVGDIVVSIPSGQLVEPGVHGVELLDAGRVDEAVHVAIPRLQPQLRRPQRHRVAHLLRQRLKRLILREFLPILSHARQQVLAHVEVLVEEDFRLHRLNGVLRDALQRLDLVLLHVVLLQGDGIDIREHLLHQHLVGIQCRMQQGIALGLRQRDAFSQTARGYLHEPLHQAVVIGQVEVMSRHRLRDKEPVHLITALKGAARHQVVALVRDGNLLVILHFPRIGIEGHRLRIIPHLRVAAQIDRAVETGFQKSDVQSELRLISLTSRLIQMMMEQLDVSLVLGQSPTLILIQLPSADDLHTLARATQKTEQRLRHAARLVADSHRLLIGRESVDLEHHETVVLQHPALLVAVLILSRKAESRQLDAPFEMG